MKQCEEQVQSTMAYEEGPHIQRCKEAGWHQQCMATVLTNQTLEATWEAAYVQTERRVDFWA